MGQDLVDIQDLMLLLGYTDPRSVKKWCKQRDIPILSLGLKKYVSQHILTQYIDNQLVKFEKTTKIVTEFNQESDQKQRQQKDGAKHPGAYKPENDMVSKYLSKYEARIKS